MANIPIRRRTPTETLRYVAERLREQPGTSALLGHSLTLNMLAEQMAAESAPPRTEWANRFEAPDGRSDIHESGPAHEGGGEQLARTRMAYPWYTAIYRRTVTYGPWEEVGIREGEDVADTDGADQRATTPLRWHYGPTDSNPGPGAMWCYACGGEVLIIDGTRSCAGCGATEDADDPTT